MQLESGRVVRSSIRKECPYSAPSCASIIRIIPSVEGKSRRLAMAQVMSIDQINARFDSESVLLEEPLQDVRVRVVRLSVLHHSKDRDEVYRKAVGLRPTRFAVVYTGSMPPDTAIVL